MTDAALNTERLRTLRRCLDQLGYTLPCDNISVPLIERLFGDLAKTTESLRHLKEVSSKQEEAIGGVSLSSHCTCSMMHLQQHHCDTVRSHRGPNPFVSSMQSLSRCVQGGKD